MTPLAWEKPYDPPMWKKPYDPSFNDGKLQTTQVLSFGAKQCLRRLGWDLVLSE